MSFPDALVTGQAQCGRNADAGNQEYQRCSLREAFRMEMTVGPVKTNRVSRRCIREYGCVITAAADRDIHRPVRGGGESEWMLLGTRGVACKTEIAELTGFPGNTALEGVLMDAGASSETDESSSFTERRGARILNQT